MCRVLMGSSPRSRTPVEPVTFDTTYSGFMRVGATGRVLHDPKGGSFRFDAGAVCLDFIYTGGEGPYAVFETLHRPDDLGRWLAEPPLAAVVTAPVTRRELSAAKALRQAIWETAHDRAAQRPLSPAALAAINRAAAAPALVPELAGDGTTAGWAAPVRATQALSTLAREMIELLSGPLAGRIRECASDDCPLVFVESSRPGARRWCAMERCGNRHKLRALRARQAGDP
jgi:predicted RNA-binding Zn ribbon-like protein